jgi:hypothetical protein
VLFVTLFLCVIYHYVQQHVNTGSTSYMLHPPEQLHGLANDQTDFYHNEYLSQKRQRARTYRWVLQLPLWLCLVAGKRTFSNDYHDAVCAIAPAVTPLHVTESSTVCDQMGR